MKGSVLDLALALVFIFGFAVSLLFSFYFLEEIGAEDFFNPASVDNIGKGKENLQLLDASIIIILIAFLIGALLLAFFIRSHPAFIPIALIVLLAIVAASAQMANSYSDLTETDTFSSIALNLPKSNFVMENLPMIIAGFGFLLLIFSYGRVGV